FADPMTLLSAPEQDARIVELMGGAESTVASSWPARLRPALRTHGFARELQAFFARARAHGLDPEQVRALAERQERPDWQVAAAFHEEVLQVLDAQNLLDYAELVHRARLLATDPVTGPALARRFDLVVVDEYQDTDPAQVALLRALVAGGRDLVAVGDPDQSIYAFRGAEVGGIWSFAHDFATAAGPAPTLSLTTARRFGPAIAAATRSIVAGLGATGGVDAATFAAFRAPTPSAAEPGEVVVQTFRTPAAEADHVATLLRRAHLDDGVPWSEMAVLVRSASLSVPRLQRSLAAAGVPVEIAGDEVPLRSEPAVAPLLLGLRLAARLARRPDRAEVAPLDPSEVVDFLTGPLGRLDATALRRLGRTLRRIDAAADERTVARPSAELLAEALAEPLAFALAVDAGGGQPAERAREAATRLHAAKALVEAHEPPEQVLWSLWDASAWARRLRAQADHGGDDARAAHRDLDAVCALFSVAARADEQRRRRGVEAFLDEVGAQQIPADTLADRGVRREAVRLMTAHRSKGLEWSLVVVAGVQEEVWPDVRHRGSLLQPERLVSVGGVADTVVAPGHLARLAEERRLFYVACTRARARLVVTAVESAADDGQQPSRFLLELRRHATVPPGPPLARPERPLSLRGVVAELRSLAEGSPDADVRDAAAARLAVLAASGHEGAAAARPSRWWGVRDVTRSEVPVRPADEPLQLSGSALDGLVGCPLSWFLRHEAKGESASSSAQGFGLLVHALAADLVRGDREADATTLAAHLETVWDAMAFQAPWVSVRERREAVLAVQRLVEWHRAQDGRTPVAAELSFEVSIPVGDDTVVLRGSMDRVEVDVDGLVRVVDFKTGKNKVKGDELAAHPQLGVYQAAVEHGAVDGVLGRPARSGGAELVHLRLPAGARLPLHPAVQPQDGPRDDAPLAVVTQLSEATRSVRDEVFAATPNDKACAFCTFKPVCPAQPEGRTVLPTVSEEPA
ncbi:ATP-dependent helicase, partial [Solicola sp. PLA-1-18]|uniref:ATP-dependent helicase n=1 Tax=Solicola sp. PLA-1-18 TaxID=3380532 RepID=UPI003B7FA943